MGGHEFDFSALHREPTPGERKQVHDAAAQGHLGPAFEPPRGIGCEIMGWLVLAGLAALFLAHWHDGAGTVARVIESVIVLVLVGVGVATRFAEDPDKADAKRVATVQFAWANDITPWYGTYEGHEKDVPVAARPDGCNELTIEADRRFRWTMSGREVQAGQFTYRGDGLGANYEQALLHTRRYVAVRHDGDLPRCRYGPITGSPMARPTTRNELDWKRVDFDDHDPPTRWAWCENRAPARVREVFSTDWLQHLDTFDQVEYLEIDREWVSLRIKDDWDEPQAWEDAIGAMTLVIDHLVEAAGRAG